MCHAWIGSFFSSWHGRNRVSCNSHQFFSFLKSLFSLSRKRFFSRSTFFPTARVFLLLRDAELLLEDLRYESEAFQNVVNGSDIISWAAVDQSRHDSHSEELIGFVTANIVPAKEREVLEKMMEEWVYCLMLPSCTCSSTCP